MTELVTPQILIRSKQRKENLIKIRNEMNDVHLLNHMIKQSLVVLKCFYFLLAVKQKITLVNASNKVNSVFIRIATMYKL